MNYQDFIKLESTVEKAAKALSGFASEQERENLATAVSLVAELRLAAMTLCDKNASSKHVQDAELRLLSLFDKAS